MKKCSILIVEDDKAIHSLIQTAFVITPGGIKEGSSRKLVELTEKG